MNFRLVITEKPSVAHSIAKVIGAYQRHEGYLEGSGYLVSWCVGHLVELAQPDVYDEKYKKWRLEDLPILPERWKWIVSADKQKQFSILKDLMHRADVTEIIAATDAGREGELIFRLVYQQAGCSKPFKRLWISSMEDAAIKEGFAALKDGHTYDRLYEAALLRAEADWLVGINCSRLFTKIYDRRLAVGRVQTPTLCMIVDRDRQISEFKKEKYYNVHLNLRNFEALKEKIADEKEACALAEACEGQTARIIRIDHEKKQIRPPKLYDLTMLQREANRYLGYTAQRTLNILQSLYEKKLVTYPRTDSQYLTEDMIHTAEEMLCMVKQVFEVEDDAFPPEYDIAQVLNSSKVTDHHAIIPTAELGKQDLSLLSKEERAILLLIAMRLVIATGKKQVIHETMITVECAGCEFCAKGKQTIEKGWNIYEEELKKRLKERSDPLRSDPSADKTLPDVSEGAEIEKVSASVSEHFTAPPKPYSEDSLLSAMETAGNEDFEKETEKKGIGTPATRASMIEKLVSSGYVQRKGKQMTATEEGKQLAEVLPEELKSAAMTAEWENSLLAIERADQDGAFFMAGIVDFVRAIVETYNHVSEEEKGQFLKADTLGNCPVCGSPVREGKRNFYCTDRECRFALWKENRYLAGMKKQIDRRMAKALLSKGRVRCNDLYSAKKDSTFTADLLMKVVDGRAQFSLEFPKKKDRKKKS